MRTKGRMSAVLSVLLACGLHVARPNVLKSVPDEQRLLNAIYRNYDSGVRPAYNVSLSVGVKFGLSLVRIIDLVGNHL